MEEIMHSIVKLMAVGDIDYKNEEQVEEQTAIRRDLAENLQAKGDVESITEAGVLHGEINQITRRFVNGKSSPDVVPAFIKRDLESKINLALRVQGWTPSIANVRAKSLADAICPVLTPLEELDKEMVKGDLFDISVAFLNIIANLK